MGKTLIFGSGISGKGAEKLLSEIGTEHDYFSDGDELTDDVDSIVLSPGIDPKMPVIREAISRGIEVIGELELGYRHALADIIAVTGTNGKTTTVTLIESLLRNCGIGAYALGNNGVSFAGSARKLGLSDVAVLEVSSFQLETIKRFTPKIAVLLNITEDHLERHGTMENYILYKRRIFMNQTGSDYAVLNYDDPIVRDIDVNSDTYYFSLKSPVRGAYLSGNSVYFKDRTVEYVCAADDVAMKGEHNMSNALSVITVAKILNIPNSVIARTLREFKTPAHRMQLVGIVGGARYYDDSKATNPDAALKACNSMIGKTTLLLGGYDKGLDYTDFMRELPLKVSSVICYGANRKSLIKSAENICSLTVIEAEDLEDAVKTAAKIKAENVLLSPATSSYDSYKSYAERGDHFISLVRALDGERGGQA